LEKKKDGDVHIVSTPLAMAIEGEQIDPRKQIISDIFHLVVPKWCPITPCGIFVCSSTKPKKDISHVPIANIERNA
jgi:hypothetical protein